MPDKTVFEEDGIKYWPTGNSSEDDVYFITYSAFDSLTTDFRFPYASSNKLYPNIISVRESWDIDKENERILYNLKYILPDEEIQKQISIPVTVNQFVSMLSCKCAYQATEEYKQLKNIFVQRFFEKEKKQKHVINIVQTIGDFTEPEYFVEIYQNDRTILVGEIIPFFENNLESDMSILKKFSLKDRWYGDKMLLNSLSNTMVTMRIYSSNTDNAWDFTAILNDNANVLELKNYNEHFKRTAFTIPEIRNESWLQNYIQKQMQKSILNKPAISSLEGLF